MLERMWEIKGRPWGTILIAKFRWPSRERKSHLKILVAKVWLLITLEILSIFSLGSKAWNLTELRRISRNSRKVASPSVFLGAIGMPSSEKSLRTILRRAVRGECPGLNNLVTLN